MPEYRRRRSHREHNEHRERRSERSGRSSSHTQGAPEPEAPLSQPNRDASPTRSTTSSGRSSTRATTASGPAAASGGWVRRTSGRPAATAVSSQPTHELSARNLREHRTTTLWRSSSHLVRKGPGGRDQLLQGVLPLVAGSVIPGLAIYRLPRKFQQIAGGVYAAGSVASFLLYRYTHTTAYPNRHLTSEPVAHLVNLLGGWPGALVAGLRWQPTKPRKKRHQQIFWATILAHQIAWLDLASNGQVGRYANIAWMRCKVYTDKVKRYLPNWKLNIRLPKINWRNLKGKWRNINWKFWEGWRVPSVKETIEKIPTPAKKAARKAAEERQEAQRSQFGSVFDW